MPSLNVTMVGSHVYDAVEQRIRLRMDVRLGDFSFPWDLLLLHKEGAMYQIDAKASTCVKSSLEQDFQPLSVPPDAASVAPYTMTVTESGCIPVSYEIHTELFGCFFGRFYNNVRNVVDPDALKPPPYCPGPGVKTQGPPVDFLSLLNRAAK
uniref:Uncharacterized protein n=1 Tax=Knipowitschia caucasica TaxID=637954 RepID=A0AAV2KNL1_KNICA